MTSYEKNLSLLKAFQIPEAEAEENENIRKILARLLTAGSIRLANLQTARDIYESLPDKDPKLYLFLAALFISRNQGNAFMKAASVGELLKTGGYIEESRKTDDMETQSDYETSVDNCLGNTAFNLDGKPFLVNGSGNWYFSRDKNDVDKLNKKFREFLKDRNATTGAVDQNRLDTAAKFNSFSLNDAQRKAVKKAVTQSFTVITGGPGTGKTTTVCSILRALLAMHTDWTEKDIALAAPTGRAAQRMAESILDQSAQIPKKETLANIAGKLKSSTIHRLLGGYAPDWKHNEKTPLEQKIVIVDEVSMVDIHLMQALLAALSKDTKLILLGDPDQLPSVDTGALLGDLTNNVQQDYVARLTTCERAKGLINDVAQSIKSLQDGANDATTLVGNWEKIDKDTLETKNEIKVGESVFQWLIPQDNISKNDVFQLYEKWMSASKLFELAENFPKSDRAFGGEGTEAANNLFKELNRYRILTLVRDGWYGVEMANECLFKKAKERANINADYLSLVGVPIMVTKNTPERDLFNGDVGVTVKGPDGMVVLFPRGKKTLACPVSLLPEHELAYAMTVHKSQGSEFENVMVVLPDDDKHPLLNRQIVYTGITRAKKRAVIVGKENAVTAALSKKQERNTGIDLTT